MSILSDISALLVDVRDTMKSVTRSSSTNPLSDTYEKGKSIAKSGRFFERPVSSVARVAKSSVGYYPLVISEGIDPKTSALIVKFAQVRAAEYTKVAIGNMDIQDAKDKLTSKTSILSLS